MTRDEVLHQILYHGPTSTFPQMVLVHLSWDADAKGLVTPLPGELAKVLHCEERTVRKVLLQLEDQGWLVPQKAGEVWVNPFPHGRTRGRDSTRERAHPSVPKTKDTNTNRLVGQGNHKTVSGLSEVIHRQPSGTGQRASLGVDNCSKCGGTGWMQVPEQVKGYPNVVDVCTCRGGPSVRPASVSPERTQNEEEMQALKRMRNLLGIDGARKANDREDDG